MTTEATKPKINLVTGTQYQPGSVDLLTPEVVPPAGLPAPPGKRWW